MPNEFTVGFRTAEANMDTMVPLGMAAEGIGAATYLIAFLAGSKLGGAAGLCLVAAGAAALFAHLGHPRRSWRVIAEAGRAWMSRGALFTGALVVLGAAALLLQGEGTLLLLVRALALSCTFVVVAYAGILFASIQAVPFWNTSLLPLLFVLHSLASAGLLLLALLCAGGGGIGAFPRECGAVLALLSCTASLTWLLPASASRCEAAQESVRLLTSGGLQRLFRGGALGAGLASPLLLVLLAYALRTSPVLAGLMLTAAVALRLAGDVSFRFALLRAGVYTPVI